MGYSISKEGIAPDPKHVEKIKKAKAPTNDKQLESFFELANFYGRMVSEFATKMLSLNKWEIAISHGEKCNKKPLKT